MTFKAQKDRSFMNFMWIIIMFEIVAVGIIMYQMSAFIWMIALLAIPAITLSTVFGISYQFHKDYLHIKGGIFRSRIPYDSIRKVESLQFTTMDILSGYRVLASKNGIALFYNKGFGSVRISPTDKDLFITELKQRSPHAEFINK